MLSTTVWTKLGQPPGFPWNDSSSSSSITVSPCNPAVLYLNTGSYDTKVSGMYRSLDAGATWSRIARVQPNYTGTDHLDVPIDIRIDPANPLRIYAIDGVRGDTMGFWVSNDGGDSFVMPEGFNRLSRDYPGMFPYDLYSIAVNPTDFRHILLGSHSAWGWTDSRWNTSSGVLESKDGGASWVAHDPVPGWGTGHAINFLYNPALGIGNASTWLLGTQGPGMWRTTDAGRTWTQVTTSTIQHGGGTVYHDKAGILYASGTYGILRSIDNGATWTEVGPRGGYSTVFGDGRLLYIHPLFSTGPFFTSPEGDGNTWTPMNQQQLLEGPFQMALDPVNGILYASLWGQGLWALKVTPR